MFLKKFIIPRALNKKKTAEVFTEIKRNEGKYNTRYLKEIKEEGSKIFNKKKTKQTHLDNKRILVADPSSHVGFAQA